MVAKRTLLAFCSCMLPFGNAVQVNSRTPYAEKSEKNWIWSDPLNDLGTCLFEVIEPYNSYITAGFILAALLQITSALNEKDSKRAVFVRWLFPAHTIFARAFWVVWLFLVPGLMVFVISSGVEQCGIGL